MPNPWLALQLSIRQKRCSQVRQPVGVNYGLPSNKTWPRLAWLLSKLSFQVSAKFLFPQNAQRQPRIKKMGCNKNTTQVYIKQMKNSKNVHFWNGHIMVTNINIGGCFLKTPIIKLDAWTNSDTLKYLLPILLIGLNKKLVTYSLWHFKYHLQATMPNPGLALRLNLTPKKHSQARRSVGDNYLLPSNKTWPCLAWLASKQPS